MKASNKSEMSPAYISFQLHCKNMMLLLQVNLLAWRKVTLHEDPQAKPCISNHLLYPSLLMNQLLRESWRDWKA